MGRNLFIRNDDNEGHMRYELNIETGKVGLDTGPGWKHRCSTCDVKLGMRPKGRKTNRSA